MLARSLRRVPTVVFSMLRSFSCLFLCLSQVKLTYDQRKERVAAKKDEIRAARLAEEE